MKRRLNVAISLIGDPKVVYMDKPNIGVDLTSRNNLWNMVKQDKQKRAIILTRIGQQAVVSRYALTTDGLSSLLQSGN
ncbi:ABC transporter A family member 7 [Artemisia annua]|uniref:ABC transporter A family member 7 n=1 Tax=Artemisia annua TaxID=35608 RepID=A0A2U1Q1X4_ARTAN|nr:ABC transporter A family member 7 [Artemisia annua]